MCILMGCVGVRVAVDFNEVRLLMLDDFYGAQYGAEIEDSLAEQRNAENDHQHPTAFTGTQE